MNGAIHSPHDLKAWVESGSIPGAPPAIRIRELFEPIRLIRTPTSEGQPIGAHL
jgi:hypothetical protein